MLALVGVVAIAATGSTTSGTGDTRPPTATLFDTILSLGLLGVVVGGAMFLYGLTQREAIAREMARRRHSRFAFLGFAVLMLLLTLGYYWRIRNYSSREQQPGIGEQGFPGGEPSAPTPGAQQPDQAYEPRFAWIPVVVVVSLAFTAVVAYLVAERRRRGPARSDETLAEQLAIAFDGRARPSRGLPRACEDARRAVVRADPEHALCAHPVHTRSDAHRRHGLVDLESARRRLRVSPRPDLTNLLLSDEINRAPPKTQAALLEAMQERQVTIEGETHLLERPFLVIATQNPIEYEGTYPLPEAQLDRFLLRTAFGYPGKADEIEVLGRRIERKTDDVELSTVVDRATLLEMQKAVERAHVAESVREYCVDLVIGTRDSPSSAVGASPRGSLALLKLARCRAALAGRDYVLPDDVKAIAVPALAHRLVLRPELWVQRVSAEDVVREVLSSVPTPRADDVEPAARS